ncbi:MAG: FAD-binding oxidoreductase [Crocinitomicaceae bacterium]|nr:MAG: FAD-binding oxidoreductase [Crocinitomicaceae bacterium]
MNDDKQKNTTLVVGAGIAGICVARRLFEKNIPFKVVDLGQNDSSRVAAGVINPLVFRRTTLSWRVEEFIPALVPFYQQLAAEWGNTYYQPIPIRRAFAHQQETDTWLKKQTDERYIPFMKTLDQSDLQNQNVLNTCGTGEVLQTAYIKTAALLDDARNWLQSIGVLIEKEFNFDTLDPENATYDGVEYAHIIFCEGHRGVNNPYFNYLPLETTKGEILTVESDELPAAELLNRKCFILPIGNQQFKVGATYTWKTATLDLTEEAKKTLIEQAQSLVSGAFHVVNHQAGIRPTVLDRRPLIGTHPQFHKLKIFNGLGAKGYMMAPLLSQEFVASLETGSDLHPEIDIKRYEKLKK